MPTPPKWAGGRHLRRESPSRRTSTVAPIRSTASRHRPRRPRSGASGVAIHPGVSAGGSHALVVKSCVGRRVCRVPIWWRVSRQDWTMAKSVRPCTVCQQPPEVRCWTLTGLHDLRNDVEIVFLRKHRLTRIELFELPEPAQLSAFAQRLDAARRRPRPVLQFAPRSSRRRPRRSASRRRRGPIACGARKS
jgi:hypothetical protein